MIYALCRSLALRVMKTPDAPPEAPAGSHESVSIFRASPRYLGYRMVLYWFGFGFLWLFWSPLPIVGFLKHAPAALIVAGVLALFLLAVQGVAYFCLRLDFDQRYYVVTDRSLRVRHGALIVREMTVSHANVQNLRVGRGPIEKLFGLWTLRVDTAGGGAAPGKGQHDTGHSIEFAGIENAYAVRDQILSYLEQHSHDAGLGDPDDHRHGASLSPRVLEALRAVRDSAAALRRECAERI